MKIALLGLGTVGSGVIKLLEDNQLEIEKAAGEKIEIEYIYSRSIRNYHHANLDGIKVTNDIREIINSDIEVAVETLGGIDFSLEVTKQFLKKGIHVVTANKDLLALYIDELEKIGNQNWAKLSYEASCAGGVPIIHTINYGLNANKINGLKGILNGTTNYILTKMIKDNVSFKSALEEASEKGYAEADPTNDVEGIDAKRKIILLSRLAYKQKVDFNQISTTGISSVELQDVQNGRDNGLILKLIGQSQIDRKTGEIYISVEPVFLSKSHPLSTVSDEKNAVYVHGDAVGETMLYGPGAGSFETASAVVSDVINTAKFGYVKSPIPEKNAEIKKGLPDQSYYIRFNDHERVVYEKIKKFNLSEENIKLINTENGTTIVTPTINEAVFIQLKNELTINASYPVSK